MNRKGAVWNMHRILLNQWYDADGHFDSPLLAVLYKIEKSLNNINMDYPYYLKNKIDNTFIKVMSDSEIELVQMNARGDMFMHKHECTLFPDPDRLAEFLKDFLECTPAEFDIMLSTFHSHYRSKDLTRRELA